MKKFNLRKWELIQERYNALCAAARQIGNEWIESKEIYQRSFAIFQRDYQDSASLDKSKPHVFDVIKADARRTFVEVDTLVALMNADWPKAAIQLNVPAGFFGKNGLLQIYSEMRQMLKLHESRERANEARKRYGACFNTLNDFARNYHFDEKSRLFPVADVPNPYENYGKYQSEGFEVIQ